MEIIFMSFTLVKRIISEQSLNRAGSKVLGSSRGKGAVSERANNRAALKCCSPRLRIRRLLRKCDLSAPECPVIYGKIVALLRPYKWGSLSPLPRTRGLKMHFLSP